MKIKFVKTCFDVLVLAVLSCNEDANKVYNTLGRRQIFFKETAFAGFGL